MAILDVLLKVKDDGTIALKKFTSAAKDSEKATTSLQTKNKSLSSSYTKLKSDMLQIAGVATTIYATAKAFQALSDAMQFTIRSGFEYNKQIESAQAGLQTLSLAIQDKNIPVMQRMAIATEESTAAMRELEKINAATPHTLDQTNQIYKAMYVSMKNVGASSNEIIGLTQKLSVAAGAAGIEFNSLLAGVDGLATGTVLANSDLGRFLGSLGLTNDVLKESTDVVALLNEKLEDFKALDTYSTSVSNFKNAWDQLSGSLTKDLFVGVKQGFNEMSNILNNLSGAELQRLRENFNGLAIGITTAIIGMVKAVNFLAEGFESLGARIAGWAFRLENGIFLSDAQSAALERMYQKTQDNIQGRNEFVASLEKSVEVFQRSITASQQKTQTTLENAAATDILNEKIIKNSEYLGQATDAELEKIYADELLALGLDAQGDAIELVNNKLLDSVDNYSLAASAVAEYENGINSLSQTLDAAAKNGSDSGVYSTFVTTDPAYTPNAFNDYNSSAFAAGTSGGLFAFASGGYTGDVGVNDVAGIVHGQEYVVNAQTTKDLGLNGSGGTFDSIDSKLDALFDISKNMAKMLRYTKDNNEKLDRIATA